MGSMIYIYSYDNKINKVLRTKKKTTHENIILNSLKIIPFSGVNAADASQKARKTQALPSYPWLEEKLILPIKTINTFK